MTINFSQIMTLIQQAVYIALLLIFAVTIAQAYGVRIPMVPTMPPLNLLYFCGAWALLQGGAWALLQGKVKLG